MNASWLATPGDGTQRNQMLGARNLLQLKMGGDYAARYHYEGIRWSSTDVLRSEALYPACGNCTSHKGARNEP